ncbi:MAG: triose-phosphate isomerase [Halodesulfurarchaeum sp.]
MFVLVNLKAYDCDPVAIGRAAATASDDTGVRVAVAPQTADIASVAETGVETWAQHVDPIDAGSHTGHTLADRVAAAGAEGTVLNHSERQLPLAAIDDGVAAADRAGLETVVCAETPRQVRAATALDPDAVAVEPPELIGSGTPVSRADPDIVRDAVDAAADIAPGIEVYCGAGITTGADVTAAADLGATGVLLASGVAAADDPRDALETLLAGV